MSKDSYIPIGNRVMDTGFLRDKNEIEYTGEALVLACLLHATGRRTEQSEKELARLLDDPNLKD